MAYETLIVETPAEGVQLIRLNRPQALNSFNGALHDALIAALDAAAADADVRCVVLSGAGGTFCAGGDLHELADALSDSAARSTTHAINTDAMLRAVNTAPQVVVAIIEGAAMGAGLGLVCVSDIAVASEDEFVVSGEYLNIEGDDLATFGWDEYGNPVTCDGEAPSHPFVAKYRVQ